MTAPGGTDERIGATIAERYKLRRLLGRGGMGAVYEAEHAVTHRRVAIKLMHATDGGWAPVAAERFVREARVVAAIGHPNIVEVLDAGTHTDGCPYMALALLEGESLAAKLAREGALDAREALAIAAEVLEALCAAHTRGVVHRDIKPENVFVSGDAPPARKITLLDFGISKVVADNAELDAATLTRTGHIVGTADYMSPEQARGDDEIDGRADVWAVGVLLYRMIAGRLPFAARNANRVMLNVLLAAPDPLAGADGAPASPGVRGLVDRALEKAREDRWPDARAMLARARALLEGRGDAIDGEATTAAARSDSARADIARTPAETGRAAARRWSTGATVGLALAALAAVLGAGLVVRSAGLARATTVARATPAARAAPASPVSVRAAEPTPRVAPAPVAPGPHEAPSAPDATHTLANTAPVPAVMARRRSAQGPADQRAPRGGGRPTASVAASNATSAPAPQTASAVPAAAQPSVDAARRMEPARDLHGL